MALSEKDEKIIKKAAKHYKSAQAAESDNREEMRDDLRFSALDQWPEELKGDRKGRPMLVLDRTGQAVRKIMGDIRQSLPSIKVDPVDDGADKATAEIMEDLTRQIEYQSSAQNVYMKAAESQVKMGYGCWRVKTDFNNFDTFEQDIQICPIKNPFSVYFDPAAKEQSKKDGRFVISETVMPTDEFEEKYGKDAPKKSTLSSTGGYYRDLWWDDETVTVLEYWVKESIERKLVVLSDGTTVSVDDLDDVRIQEYALAGVVPVKDRTVKSYQIKYYVLTGFEVLEEKDWPSRYFPIVPVYGEEDIIEGRSEYRGVIRAAKDPQRLYNYWNSAAAETIALQPKAPFVGTAKQFAKYKRFWERANIDNLPYLPYEPDGQAPAPSRQAPPTLQNGLLQQAAIASDDIKAATGIYDASLGARSNEVSGIAIQARQLESQIQNSVYLYNLAAAIEHTGAIIVDMIPLYYDTQLVIKIRGEDGRDNQVLINAPIMTPDGAQIQNDLTRGKYDVRIDVGPNFKSRRAEAASSMVELARVFPQLIDVAGDLVAKNLDWPGAEEIAERLRKLLPPGLADDGEQQVDPQVLQAQLMQQQLAMEEMQAEIENTRADTEKKISEAQKNDVESAVKMQQSAMKEQEALLKVLQ